MFLPSAYINIPHFLFFFFLIFYFLRFIQHFPKHLLRVKYFIKPLKSPHLILTIAH